MRLRYPDTVPDRRAGDAATRRPVGRLRRRPRNGARVRRLIRDVWCGGWLVAALVGLPPLLFYVCRVVLANIDVREALADPLTPPVVVLAGAWVGCAVWAWLVYATVADLVERCRRLPRRRPRLPVPRLPVPLHVAVTGLTGSVVLLVNSIAGHLSGAPGAATPPASAPTLDHQPASPTSASAAPPSTVAVFASTTAPD